MFTKTKFRKLRAATFGMGYRRFQEESGYSCAVRVIFKF